MMNVLDIIRNIRASILEQIDTIITKDLLFGNIFPDDTSNILILSTTSDYFIRTKWFDTPIFAQKLELDEVIQHNLLHFC